MSMSKFCTLMPIVLKVTFNYDSLVLAGRYVVTKRW